MRVFLLACVVLMASQARADLVFTFTQIPAGTGTRIEVSGSGVLDGRNTPASDLTILDGIYADTYSFGSLQLNDFTTGGYVAFTLLPSTSGSIWKNNGGSGSASSSCAPMQKTPRNGAQAAGWGGKLPRLVQPTAGKRLTN